jgi:competence protein ComEC
VTAFSLPLVQALLALLAGMLPGLRLGGRPAVLASAAVLALLAPAAWRAWSRRPARAEAAHAAVLLALALAGAALGTQARADAAGDCRAHLPDGAALELTGTLGANRPSGNDSLATPLLPVEVAALKANGRLVPGCAGEFRVRLPDGVPLRAGSEVEVRGEWVMGERPVLPGAWPMNPSFGGMVSATWARSLPPSFAAHPLLVARGAMEARIQRLFGPHGAMADALLLGRREGLDPVIKRQFAASGLVHLLAISGGHVGLIGAILLLAARACRLSHRTAAWAAIGLVAVYLAVIGAPPSAVRAGIMLALALLARILQRPSAPAAFLAAAAMAILVLDPMAALDAGFQLSFAGVLGIAALRRPLLDRVPKAWRRGKWRKALVESTLVSIAAFAATAPIVATQFGQVAPISIVANLPAIPLTSLALVGIVASVAADVIAPGLAGLLADGAGLAMDGLTRVVDAAAAVPWGHAAVDAPRWDVILLVVLVFAAVLRLAGGLQSVVRWGLAAAFALSSAVALPGFSWRPGGGDLELDFIDVGQGDAVALRTPHGRWVLVDAGPRDEHGDAGKKRVLPFLRARGAEHVDALVITHPHADHIGGAVAVMDALAVDRLIDPGLVTGNPEYVETLRTAQERGVRWTAARQGASLVVDGVSFDFLWPDPALLDSHPDANEISAVIRVRYGGFAALLTGDAEAPAEHAMVQHYGDRLRAQLLKSGHHGSRTSSTEELVRRVRPELAVISVGRRNRYGHPNDDVLQRYAAHHVRVARTDRDGTVTVRVHADGTWAREAP